ncbi:MAG: UDP-2,3-diacylglucosamine diphosphatase LpxI [Caulobacteraceae bacterium]
MPAAGRLGLIAGRGSLPLALANHCQTSGRPLFVIRLRGFAGPELDGFDGEDVGLAELGRGIAALRRAGCEAVCFAGYVERPDLAHLKPDLRGLAALPGVLAAARRGDGNLLGHLLGEFEKEGFRVEGAHEVMGGLLLGEGPAGRHAARPDHLPDVVRALAIARAIGALDVGQAAVCCEGLVLAVEAQEGTDAMLGRVAGLPTALRGGAGRRRGVLAKACKPGHETRIDLPTIGPTTVRHAAAAGLAGIAGEAGRLLIVDRTQTIALADTHGLFLIGAPSDSP